MNTIESLGAEVKRLRRWARVQWAATTAVLGLSAFAWLGGAATRGDDISAGTLYANRVVVGGADAQNTVTISGGDIAEVILEGLGVGGVQIWYNGNTASMGVAGALGDQEVKVVADTLSHSASVTSRIRLDEGDNILRSMVGLLADREYAGGLSNQFAISGDDGVSATYSTEAMGPHQVIIRRDDPQWTAERTRWAGW